MSDIRRDKMVPGFKAGLADADNISGGVFVKKTKVLRNAIGKGFRVLTSQLSTLCFVTADNTMYELIANPDTEGTSDSDWRVVLKIASGLTPLGTWNISNAAPEIFDEDAVDQAGNFYFVTGAASPTLINIPGLFADQSVTVKDGDLIVSNDSIWFVNAINLSWDTLDKPQVIIDYVNGEVISHTHEIVDITGLQDELDTKFDEGDVAPLDEDYGSIPDVMLIDFGFLKEYFYPKSALYSQDEIDDFFSSLADFYTKSEVDGLFDSFEITLHEWTNINFYDKPTIDALLAEALDGIDGVIIGQATETQRDSYAGGDDINGYDLTEGHRLIVTDDDDGKRYVEKFTGTVGQSGPSFWLRLYLYDSPGGGEVIDFTEVDTTGANVTLDFAEKTEGDFDGSDPIDEEKTWALANAANSREFSFRFDITGSFPQNFPEEFKSWTNDFNSDDHIWTPSDPGLYEVMGRKRANGDWIIKFFGPNR